MDQELASGRAPHLYPLVAKSMIYTRRSDIVAYQACSITSLSRAQGDRFVGTFFNGGMGTFFT
jgi:hypothetical protein